MTRTGKIARLPQDVREELNQRLRDGWSGRVLLGWLNQHPAIKRVLAAHFGGRLINHVNLTQWRKGGYVEWLAQQELVKQAQELSAKPEELAALVEGRTAESLATLLALRYAGLMMGWKGEATPEFRRKLRTLSVLSASILALRRIDHNNSRLKLEQDRHEFERRWAGKQRSEELAGAKEQELREMFDGLMRESNGNRADLK